MKHLLAMETWKTVLLLGPLGVVLLIAAWTDLRERKVYNKLTYPAILIGLLLHTITLGLDGFLSGLLAASLMLVIGLFLIVTPAIKGGDIKLLMVVGAFAGGKALLEVSFYAVFAGFFLGLFMSLKNGYLRVMLTRLWRLLKGYLLMLLYRSRNFEPTLEEDERSKIPFAIAIFVGGILVVTEHLYGLPGLLSWYASSLGFTL